MTVTVGRALNVIAEKQAEIDRLRRQIARERMDAGERLEAMRQWFVCEVDSAFSAAMRKVQECGRAGINVDVTCRVPTQMARIEWDQGRYSLAEAPIRRDIAQIRPHEFLAAWRLVSDQIKGMAVPGLSLDGQELRWKFLGGAGRDALTVRAL